MAQHNSRLLSSHPEAYSRSFQCFLASTNQENAILQCIEKHIVPVITKRISDLQEVRASNKSPYRVLSVGSGEGENDISILKALNDKIPLAVGESLSLFNRVIEPDVDRLASFRTKAENLAEHFRRHANIDFEWIPMTFEEYTSQKKADDVKFNVVHFMHSIYYLGVEDALVHCYEKELGKEGIIISIAQSEEDPMMMFAAKFPDVRSPSTPRNRDVVATATQRGWRHFACPGDSNNLDITNIFDSSSREGNNLLDFLTNRVDVRQNEEKETLERILKFWKDQSFMSEQGRKIVKLRDNAVIILKGFDH
ncbi:histamine N-methyltransferase-like [Oculina patagonica]